MNNPAWQAIVPELVPRDELPDAIALNSAGFQPGAGRGPGARRAHGGRLRFGHAWARASVFLLNSLSFLAVIVVLYAGSGRRFSKARFPPSGSSGPCGPACATCATRRRCAPFCCARSFHGVRQRRVGAAGRGGAAGSPGGRHGLRHAQRLPGPGRRHRRGSAAAPPAQVHAEWMLAGAGTIFTITLLTLALTRSVPLLVLWLVAAGCAWTTTTPR